MISGSPIAVGLLYGAGFFYGACAPLAIMAYWRRRVVQLWVEGFF